MYYYEPIKVGDSLYHFYFDQDVFKYVLNKTRSEKTLRTLIAQQILQDHDVRSEGSHICVVTLAYRKDLRKREGDYTVACGIGNYFNTNLDLAIPVNAEEVKEEKPAPLVNLPPETEYVGGIKIITKDKSNEVIQAAKNENKKIIASSKSPERFLPEIPAIKAPTAIDEKNYHENLAELERRLGLNASILDNAINGSNPVTKIIFSQSDQAIVNSIDEKKAEITQLVESPSVESKDEEVKKLSDNSLKQVKLYANDKIKQVEKDFKEFTDNLIQSNKNSFAEYKKLYKSSIESHLNQIQYGQPIVAIQYLKERLILAAHRAAYDYLINIAWQDKDREKKLNDFKKKFGTVFTFDSCDGLIQCSCFEDFRKVLSQKSLIDFQKFIVQLRKGCNTTTGGSSDATKILNQRLNELLIDSDFKKTLNGLITGPAFSFSGKEDFTFADQLLKLEENLPRKTSETLSQLSQNAQQQVAAKQTKIPDEQQSQKLASFALQFDHAIKNIQAYRQALILKQEMDEIEVNCKGKLKEFNEKAPQVSKEFKNFQKQLEKLANEFNPNVQIQMQKEMQSEIIKLISAYSDSSEKLRSQLNNAYSQMFSAEGPIVKFGFNLSRLMASNNHVSEYLKLLKQTKDLAKKKFTQLTEICGRQSSLLTETLPSFTRISDIPHECATLTQECATIANQSYLFDGQASFTKDDFIDLNDRFYADKLNKLNEKKSAIEDKRNTFFQSFNGPLPKLTSAVQAKINEQIKSIEAHQKTIEENQKKDSAIFLCHMIVNILLDFERWKKRFYNSNKAAVIKNGKTIFISKNILELIAIVKATHDWQKDAEKAKFILTKLIDQVKKQDLSHLAEGSQEIGFITSLSTIDLNSQQSIRAAALNTFVKPYCPQNCAFVSPHDLNQFALPEVKIQKPFAERHRTLHKIWNNTKSFFGHPTTKKILKGAAIVGAGLLLLAALGVVVYFAAPTLPVIAPIVFATVAYAEATLPPVALAATVAIGPGGTAAIAVAGSGLAGAGIGGGLTAAYLGIKKGVSKLWSGIKSCFGFGNKQPENFPHAELPKPQESPKNSPAASPSIQRNNSNNIINNALENAQNSNPIPVPVIPVQPNINIASPQYSLSPSPNTTPILSPVTSPVISPSTSPSSTSNFNNNPVVFSYANKATKNSTEDLLIQGLVKEVARQYAGAYQKPDPQKPNQTIRRMDDLKNPIQAIQAIFKKAESNRQNNIEEKETIKRVESLLNYFNELLETDAYKPLKNNAELNAIFPEILVSQSYRQSKVA